MLKLSKIAILSVDAFSLRTGRKFSEESLQKVAKSADKISKLPFFIDDTPALEELPISVSGQIDFCDAKKKLGDSVAQDRENDCPELSCKNSVLVSNVFCNKGDLAKSYGTLAEILSTTLQNNKFAKKDTPTKHKVAVGTKLIRSFITKYKERLKRE